MNENVDPKKAAAKDQESEGKSQNSHLHNHNSFGDKFPLLQIITVILSNGIKNIKTNALLDSGFDITSIKREVALSKTSEITSETVKISRSSVYNTFDSLTDAYVVDELNITPNKVSIADLKRNTRIYKIFTSPCNKIVK